MVEETLEGRGGRIKAYAVATSVFGRNSDFDPQLDPIVRIEAGRLRQSLERYYLTAGTGDPVRITMPRGSYMAAFEATQPFAPLGEPSPAASSPPRHSPRTRNPSIFVMSFEEEGDQSAFPNLTRGFTRQIIAALTRFTNLQVFGPDLNFRRGSTNDEAASARDLDVDFVLSGGATVSAGRLGAEVILIDTLTGQNLWAESFLRVFEPDEFVNAHEDVANRIARTLAQPYGVIFSHIARRIDEAIPERLTAYELVILSHQYARSLDSSLFEPLRANLERVIEGDPHYSEAFSALSTVYSTAYRFNHVVSGELSDPLRRALFLARHARSNPRSGFRSQPAMRWRARLLVRRGRGAADLRAALGNRPGAQPE